MDRVTILDTSIASDNLGDEIIMEAINQVILSILPRAYLYRVATHEFMSWVSRRLIRKSNLCIVGGTNLLSSHMGKGALWKILPWDAMSFNHVLLLGAGWRDYMGQPDRYTKWVLQHILCSEFTHSVRDSYAFDKIQVAGRSVVNTACPTMWGFDDSHCQTIPRRKARIAVTTLTYYRPDPVTDGKILSFLKDNYKKVYFWVQQSEDETYFRSLGLSGFTLIGRNLASYDAVLDNEDCDFIGTRLHAGIRAMQKRRRSLIIGIDNRAAEIGRDTGLPVLDRKDGDRVSDWIHGDAPTAITLPHQQIAAWKAQFTSAVQPTDKCYKWLATGNHIAAPSDTLGNGVPHHAALCTAGRLALSASSKERTI